MKRRMKAPMFRSILVLGALPLLCPALTIAQTDKPPETPAQQAATEELPWLDDLSAAYREAALKQRPIFVRVGGVGCGWCVKLDKEITSPEVQAELQRWTLVHLDLDQHPAEVRRLAVGPIPSLRVLTHSGRVVQASEGYRDATELVKWLREQFTSAMAAPDAALLSTSPPNVAEMLRLVRLFGDRDPLMREAAIRRLLPHPGLAREDVVGALKEGSLAVKLSALELLGEWRAPVQDFDPWRPETLAAEKLQPLDDWLKEELPTGATAAKELDEKEIDSLKSDLAQLATADEASATALRERIGRIGDAALPYVQAALAAATADQEHERLLAVRYRLVSPADLTLRWPGGLERLSSRDAKQRHKAADELAKFSLPELQPLLLELFGDPDPLVRELALRALRKQGGKRATAALVKLLADPDPNVRAAVLKQIAEDAQADMLKQVGKYVAREKDADLLVHAVRYLREVDKPEAVGYLLPLLEHDSWQVRAEAAEGIGSILEEKRRYGSSGDIARPEVVEKLEALLADSDPFVVNRAVKALPKSYNAKTVDALLRTAESQPTLAAQIVAQVAEYSSGMSSTRPKLLPFLENARADVRASAIRHVVDIEDDETEARLIRALEDKEAVVRIAAAEAFVDKLLDSRPVEEADSPDLSLLEPSALAEPDETEMETAESDAADEDDSDAEVSETKDSETNSEKTESEKTAAEEHETEEGETDEAETDADGAQTKGKSSRDESARDRRLRDVYSGEHRPKWTDRLVPYFEKMISGADPRERAVAAVALIPLGKVDAAWPVLLAAAAEHPEAFETANHAQRWLLSDKRREIFRELGKLAKGESQLASIFDAVSSEPDLRMADEMWALLDGAAVSAEVGNSALDALRSTYLGSSYFNSEEISEKSKVKVAAAVEPHTQQGGTFKRLLAMDLLLSFAPDRAGRIAEALLNDDAAPPDLRRDAFQILLLTLDTEERKKRAIAVLAEGDKDRTRASLRLLIFGQQSLNKLPATKYTLQSDNGFSFDDEDFSLSSGGGKSPIIPLAPKPLTAEQVRPLTQDADREVAAYAGYLLALLGEPAGLEPLLAYWNNAKPSIAFDRLVYRAIAVGDDAAYLSQLRTIYARLTDDDEKSEFYWTIRIMSGDEVLAFRDQIRKEVGIEKLKNN